MLLIVGFCWVFALFGFGVFSDEDYYQIRACCTFRGPQFADLEYIVISSFNKHNMMEYNSTRGNWTAFTPYALYLSQFWNHDPYDKLERRAEEKMMCKDNVHYIQSLGNLSTPPTVNIKLVEQPGERQPAMLICSAYDFYPKQIKLKWLRNDNKITTGVSYSDVMADGEFYYQMHSFLEFTPVPGEKFTCVVEHYSLPEPKEVSWDDSLPPYKTNLILLGICGLVLGLTTLSCGLIYYKKKCDPDITFCSGQTFVPVNTDGLAEEVENL